jgi:hypothetical protein
VKVLDFSVDSDGEKDRKGDFTHAFMDLDPLGKLPQAFTICSAVMVDAWTTDFSSATLFQLRETRTRKVWYDLNLTAMVNYTQYDIRIGLNSFPANHTAPMMFPLQWTRACLSLDPASGRVRLVVDGTVLEDRLHPGVVDEDITRPVHLSLVLGLLGSDVDDNSGWIIIQHYTYLGVECTGKISGLNIFSTNKSTAELISLTTAGGQACGEAGDYLSWEEAEWELHSEALAYYLNPDTTYNRPCSVPSNMHVYTAAFKRHTDCMQHCEKLGDGRSPPVRTLQEWEMLQLELQKISEKKDSKEFVKQTLWLSATDTTEEEVWRDYYTEADLLNVRL